MSRFFRETADQFGRRIRGEGLLSLVWHSRCAECIVRGAHLDIQEGAEGGAGLHRPWIRLLMALPDDRQERVAKSFAERTYELVPVGILRSMAGYLLPVPTDGGLEIHLKAAVVHHVSAADRDWPATRELGRESLADDLAFRFERVPSRIDFLHDDSVLVGNTEGPDVLSRSVKVVGSVERLSDKVRILEIGLTEDLALCEEGKRSVQPAVVCVLLAENACPSWVLPVVAMLLGWRNLLVFLQVFDFAPVESALVLHEALLLGLELRHDLGLALHRCALLAFSLLVGRINSRRRRVDAIDREAHGLKGYREAVGSLLPHPLEDQSYFGVARFELLLGRNQVQERQDGLRKRGLRHEVTPGLLRKSQPDEGRL